PPAPTESPAGALSLPSLSSTPGSAGLELSKTSGQLPQPEIPIMSPTTAETAKTPEVPTASPTTRTAKELILSKPVVSANSSQSGTMTAGGGTLLTDSSAPSVESKDKDKLKKKKKMGKP
ncbi:unnamed protein product, partial [Wuchereria bancrofti]